MSGAAPSLQPTPSTYFAQIDRPDAAVVLRSGEHRRGCHVADAKGNAFGNLDLAGSTA